MKKLKYYILCFSVLLGWTSLYAERVDLEKAEKVAQGYVQSRSKGRAKQNIRLKYTASKKRPHSARMGGTSEQDTAYYYVFNVNEETDGNFVIIAADDAVRPVLGYSDSGSYDENNQPPNFAWWMEEIEKQIAYAQEQNIPQSEDIKKEWEAYLSGASTFSATTVGPLIQTKWGQSEPYNNLCPLDNGQNCVTGCVATAMAQIMKYHNHPTKGSGSSPAYIASRSNILVPSVTFDVDYDWENMLDSYSGTETQQQQEAVAPLMYHCGASIKMNYSVNESEAYSADVAPALKTYFGYDKSTRYVSRNSYTNAQWDALLKEQIDAELPIYYSSTSSSHGFGHAFVCDGYDGDGRFHFNWGWNGKDDGYFATSALNPGINFDYNHAIAADIKPISGYLKELRVSEGALSPSFRPYIFDYILQVGASVESVDITGVTDISGATVTGNVNGFSLPLNDSISVDIQASLPNGESQNYRVLVLRSDPSPASASFTWRLDKGREVNYIFQELNNKVPYLTIDWGDGTSGTELSHFYNEADIYQVVVSENYKMIYPLKSISIGRYEDQNIHITQVDVREAPLLEKLYVQRGEFTQLDISRNTELRQLECSYNAQLTNLDISNNTALRWLYCYDNRLTSLDVSNNPNLTQVYCDNNCIPLVDLYKISQRDDITYKELGLQTLPDTTVLTDVPAPIDTVFYGINSTFTISPSAPANYTLNNGEITFLNVGVYEVTITNPAISGARVLQKFTVTRPATGVSLNKSTLGLFVRDTEQLVAAVAPNDANQNVMWSSDNPDVASVSDNGTVIAKAAGTATITAITEDGGFTATCAVTIAIQPVMGISLNKSTLNLIVENSEQLTATLTPANATNQNVTWSSGNPDVASVSDNGTVTAKTTGTATITATTEDGILTATCNVTVKIEYNISVVGGTASAEKAILGTTVTITADSPLAGKAFDKWTSEDVTFADINAATTTFVMPEKAVTITATYKNINYTISVTGGSADKATAIMGEEVTLTIGTPPTGKEFDRWNVTEGGVTVTNNKFIMGAENVVIEALWKNINYTIGITGGSADKATAIMGEEVALSIATPPTGKEFDRWNVTEGGVTVTNNRFTMGTENVIVEALWKNINYTLTLTDATGPTAATYQQEVTITADAAPAGKVFDRWTGGIDVISAADRNSAEVTFKMPANNVVLTATYAAVYSIAVTDGVVSHGSAREGATITISSFREGDEWQFIEWISEDVTFADATASTTTFEMPAKTVIIAAKFRNIGTEGCNVKSITIYPNPATEFIQVSEIEEGSDYSIVNSSGQIVLVGTFNGEAISIAHLPPGQYVVQIAGRVIKMVKL